MMSTLCSICEPLVYKILPLLKSRPEADLLIEILLLTIRFDAVLSAQRTSAEVDSRLDDLLNTSCQNKRHDIAVLIHQLQMKLKVSVEHQISSVQRMLYQFEKLQKSVHQYAELNSNLSRELRELVGCDEISGRKHEVGEFEFELSKRMQTLISLSWSSTVSEQTFNLLTDWTNQPSETDEESSQILQQSLDGQDEIAANTGPTSDGHQRIKNSRQSTRSTPDLELDEQTNKKAKAENCSGDCRSPSGHQVNPDTSSGSQPSSQEIDVMKL